MRIVFTGSHGVGKSTILQDPRMAKILRRADEHYEHWHYRMWDGIGRYVHTHLNKLSEKNKQRYLNWWYVYQHYTTSCFSGTRSIYDTWAYSRLLQGRWFNYKLMSWAMKHVWYDHVFYVPIEFPLEPDGIRYSDPDFQKQHDQETKLILDFYKIPYHTITGTVEERLDKIACILGQ